MSNSLRNIIISTILAVVVYLFIYYSETTTFPSLINQWPGLLITVMLVNIVGFILIKLNKQYNKWLPWRKNVSTRFLVEVSTSFLLNSTAATIFIFGYLYNVYFPTEATFTDSILDGIIKFGILTLVISYIYSLINFSIYSYNQYSVGQIQALASERLQLDLRFEALKSQLNPHFLFNALNTISSLIYLNVQQAEKYIRLLASTYTYILDTNSEKVVSVADEIEMTKSYFFMHKIKYEDFIELVIDEKVAGISGSIPPFTLQILVENALKHSVISEKSKLRIEIYSNNNNQLIVKNNIVDKPIYQSTMENLLNKQKETESYQIGLSNIRSRYKFLIDRDIEVSTGDYFKVKVPIIENYG